MSDGSLTDPVYVEPAKTAASITDNGDYYEVVEATLHIHLKNGDCIGGNVKTVEYDGMYGRVELAGSLGNLYRLSHHLLDEATVRLEQYRNVSPSKKEWMLLSRVRSIRVVGDDD